MSFGPDERLTLISFDGVKSVSNGPLGTGGWKNTMV